MYNIECQSNISSQNYDTTLLGKGWLTHTCREREKGKGVKSSPFLVESQYKMLKIEKKKNAIVQLII